MTNYGRRVTAISGPTAKRCRFKYRVREAGVAHQFICGSAFGCNAYALSASPLSHAERPLGLAFLLYQDFSWGVQRNRTTAVAGVLMGGLPLGRLSMPRLCGYRKDLTSPLSSYLM